MALIDAAIGPSKNITWVALAYTLGLSVGFLIVGRLSDIFGRRWFFIIGNTFALIGAIIGATANHVDDLIGGNLLGGLAGSVQISFTVAIAELVPNKHRPLWVVCIFFSSFEIACFGPVIAQSFVADTAAGWRWSYYLDIIVAGLAVILFFFFYHPPTFDLLHKNRSKKQQLARMDYVGFVLFTGGLAIFLIGLSWAEGTYPWKSAHVIATIVSITPSTERSIQRSTLLTLNLGCWGRCTCRLRLLRCIHSQGRSSSANSFVQITGISCHGHHGNGWQLRLLFNECHLAAADCVFIPGHGNSQRVARMHRRKVSRDQLN